MSVIAFVLALAQAGSALVAPPPVAPNVAASLPPADWSKLPDLHFVRSLPPLDTLSAFVRDEAAAGRCAAAVHSTSGYTLRADLAVLVGANGQIRRIIPRAIDCVTVEQYASGLVSRLSRDNIDMTGVTGDTWFRTSLTFAWNG